jgi:hypothetical protein
VRLGVFNSHLENSSKHFWGCFHSRYSAVLVLFSSWPFYISCPAMTLPLFYSPVFLYTVLALLVLALTLFTRKQDEVFAWMWYLNMQGQLKFMNKVPNQSLWTRPCRFKLRPALPNCHVKTNDNRARREVNLYNPIFFRHCLKFLKKHETLEASSVSNLDKEAPILAGNADQATLWLGTTETVNLLRYAPQNRSSPGQ